MKSPSQHAHAGCPLFESPAGVCSLSPHPLPFAILCESSKHFYAFLLPLSGPKRCAWVEAAALFPCSFLTSASCSLLPAILRRSRSAGISSPGSPGCCELGWAGELITAGLQSRLGQQPWETAAASRAPASYSRSLAEGDPSAGGNRPRWGERGGGLGSFLIQGGCCWMEVAGTGGPCSWWIAASGFRAVKARRLGCAQGVGEGHRWSLAFKQGSVRFQVCCERQPRQQRSPLGQVYAARTRTAKANTLGVCRLKH